MVKQRPSSTNAWQNKYIDNFTNVIDPPNVTESVIDNQKVLPYDWLQQPVTTASNKFERGNVPYSYDSSGIYCGDYKMSVQPIIVEKEVIKEVYLTPVTPFSAAVEMYKRMKGEVSEGKQIYRDDSGRIVSR